jgi:hypothetical protein
MPAGGRHHQSMMIVIKIGWTPFTHYATMTK